MGGGVGSPTKTLMVLLALKITGIQSAVGPEVDMRSMEIAKEGGSPKI
jgi:hypothetical protein